jgi:heme A synthase
MAAALVAARSRVRDETIRKYMRWMGVLVLSLLLQVGTNLLNPYLNFPLLISAYCLYGASNSLLRKAPLSLTLAGTPAIGQ